MISFEWYNLPGALNIENNPLFIEKACFDSDFKVCEDAHRSVCRKKKVRDNGRVMKSRYKKKLRRRFLSMDPSLDYSKLEGTNCHPGVDASIWVWKDSETMDSMIYNLNPYSKTFMSKRGDIRVYRGKIEALHGNHYNMNCKYRCVKKLKNSRIRHMKVDEDGGLSYAYAKKECTPNDKID